MNNKYIFLIWNKALWCKNKIINDLEKSFVINNQVYVKWSNEYFIDNLKALYGRKLGPAEDKILPCGKGKFLVLIIEDRNPIYEKRDLYDGKGLVNSKIYDKKMLYRKWTAGSHRIHCSDDEIETKHDLVVLFGTDYLKSISNNQTLYLDTKSVIGFNNIDDLTNCLDLFGNNIHFVSNNALFIFTKCRYDIECFLYTKEISNNKYELKTKEKNIVTYIFGEIDGDLPSNFIEHSKHNDSLMNYISNNVDDYIQFINYKNNNTIKDLILSNNLDTSFYKKDIKRNKKDSLFKKLKSESKLIIKRTLSIFN